jgi:hypothetical protein
VRGAPRRGHDGDTVVIPAYEFRRPGLTDALRQLDEAGCERIRCPDAYRRGRLHARNDAIAIDEAVAAMPVAGWSPSQA